MIKEYILIMLVDFRKHSSVHIDLVSSKGIIVLYNVIIEKKDIISWTDTLINLDIKFIITVLNLNTIQHFCRILQSDYTIINYSIHYPVIFCIDTSSHTTAMVGIRNYYIRQSITELVINVQLQEVIYRQTTALLIQQQLNIILYINSTTTSHYRMDLNLEYLINHLENYITLYIKFYFIYNITLVNNYLNQLIMELYDTIIETQVIRNVNTNETSYMDIKICEPYITISDTDILTYISISIVKLINNIKETRIITMVEDRANIKLIVLIYVFIPRGRQNHREDSGHRHKEMTF